MRKEIVFGKKTEQLLPRSPGPVSWGVKVTEGGKFLFIAGVLAIGQDLKLVESTRGDVVAQYRYILECIKAILEDAGGTMDNIVKWVHYMVIPTSLDEFYPELSKVRREYIQKDFPISTMVEVKSLMVEGALLEVDAIAVLD